MIISIFGTPNLVFVVTCGNHTGESTTEMAHKRKEQVKLQWQQIIPRIQVGVTELNKASTFLPLRLYIYTDRNSQDPFPWYTKQS